MNRRNAFAAALGVVLSGTHLARPAEIAIHVPDTAAARSAASLISNAERAIRHYLDVCESADARDPQDIVTSDVRIEYTLQRCPGLDPTMEGSLDLPDRREECRLHSIRYARGSRWLDAAPTDRPDRNARRADLAVAQLWRGSVGAARSDARDCTVGALYPSVPAERHAGGQRGISMNTADEQVLECPQGAVPLPAGAPVRINALGGLTIVVDDQPLRFGRTLPRKPLALLRSLLTVGDRSISPHTACESLWPEADGYDAYRALVTTVYRLRGLLRYREAVRFSAEGVKLESTLVSVDAWEFERALASSPTLPQLASALERYRGPFLGDDESPHAFEARERLQRKFIRGVRSLGHHYESIGDVPAAIALYERALDAGAVSEEIHRQLMECLARAGHRSAAAQVFERCRALLARRLCITPSSATVLAFRSIVEAGGDQPVTTSL
jgi:DNA-binding SARP family transcriptional activator